MRAAALRREFGIELGLMTRHTLLNGIVGSTLVPRPLRWAAYRAAGAKVATGNIFPGLHLAGPARNLSIGADTFVNIGCFIELVAPVRIGADCQLGMQVLIATSHHESDEDGRISRRPVGRPVIVGDRVWIGARAVLLPGVTVADDAVVAAGAVVTGDCPEPGVYAGVPARLLVREKR
ncbi:MAG: DapH/DapD/GlmU-related protein [Actinocatenispora sp.]